MDAQRDTESLTEHAEARVMAMLDVTLRAELDVDPSPEFHSRVRHAIAHTSTDRWILRRWWMPAAAAAALVIVALMIYPRPDGKPTDPQARAKDIVLPGMASGSRPDARLSEPTTLAESTVGKKLGPGNTVKARVARASTIRKLGPANGPEVIVTPGQEHALARFVQLATDGRVDVTTVTLIPSEGEFTIPPLTIELLPPLTPVGENPERSPL